MCDQSGRREGKAMQSRSGEQLIYSESFQKLIREKKRFILPATISFLIFYFALPLSITWFPQFMNRPFYHFLTYAWVFAIMQFVMVWTIGFLYYMKAKSFDHKAEEIRKEMEQQGYSS